MLSCKVNENIELRLHSQIYAEQVCAVVKQNFEHLREYMIWATEDYSVSDAEAFIRTTRTEFAETELPSFFIFEKDQLIGAIGCNNPNVTGKSVEIGYWLDKDHTGKGIVINSSKVLLDYIFNELEFNRVVIRCEPKNKKSRAIPEKLGFTKEGVAREVEKKHDKFVDLIVYSMLKKEWENI